MWSGPASARRPSSFRSIGRLIDGRRLALPIRRTASFVLLKLVQFGPCCSKIGHDVGVTHLQPIGPLDLTGQLPLSVRNGGTQLTLHRLRRCQLLVQRTFALERLRQLIAVINGLFHRGRFRPAALPSPVRPNSVRIRPPLSWPTTLARNRHSLMVTKRNGTFTNRVIVCEGLPALVAVAGERRVVEVDSAFRMPRRYRRFRWELDRVRLVAGSSRLLAA